MKKILLGLFVITTLSLQAQYTMETNMKDMRDGLQAIQDGFSYNNREGILEGIAKIRKANEMFATQEAAAKFLPKDKKRLAKISFLSTKTLNISLEEMKAYVETGKIIDASNSMSRVMHSCTRCHALVRGW